MQAAWQAYPTLISSAAARPLRSGTLAWHTLRPGLLKRLQSYRRLSTLTWQSVHMGDTQSTRITRVGWGDRILQAQRKLLAIRNSHLQLEELPIALPSQNGAIVNCVVARARPEEKDRSTNSILVLLHGWGAGLGFYSRALPHIVNQFSAVYMVDVPGMGASSRPDFPRVSDGLDASLSYFIDSLDEAYSVLHEQDPVFRNASHRHLAAHSMGAYISTEWMISKQERFDNLILISPAGVPRRPEQDSRMLDASFATRSMFKFFRSLWNLGLTPQSLVRTLPTSYARSLCHSYISRRYFGDQLPEELDALTEYMLQVSKAPKAGENSIQTILLPGAWARVPLMDRLPLVNLTTTFIYGEKDWMDWRSGDAARGDMQVKTRLAVVEKADHNVFVDNEVGFSRVLLAATADFEDGIF